MHGRLFPGLVILTTAISVGCGGAGVSSSRTSDGTTPVAAGTRRIPSDFEFWSSRGRGGKRSIGHTHGGRRQHYGEICGLERRRIFGERYRISYYHSGWAERSP